MLDPATAMMSLVLLLGGFAVQQLGLMALETGMAAALVLWARGADEPA